VIAMAIPAAIMDQALGSKIKYVEERLIEITEWINILNEQNKKLEAEIKKNKETIEAEIEKDVHNHVKKLVEEIQTLKNEIESLKQ
jgi:predicted  nucleic acid-binding Zn-ribbon protein